MSATTKLKLKLKSCPFCGGPAEYSRTTDWSGETIFWQAGCTIGHAVSPQLESAREAAQWWNRRVLRRQEPRP